MNRNYLSVDDAVYRLLSEHSDGTFPVSPLKIAKSMGVRVVAKKDARELIQCLVPDGSLDDIPALTFSLGGEKYILIDTDHGDAIYRRMLIAHELGHIVLGDGISEDSCAATRFVHGKFQRSMMEMCCDLFALALLVPRAVLALGGVRTVAEIARVCDVHPETAFIAAGSIRARKSAYSSDAFNTWRKFAPGLQERRQLVARKGAMRPSVPWLQTDISAELTF